MYKKISSHDAKNLIESGDAILLDVRTSQEYKEGHIKNSILTPLNTVYYNNDIPEDKDASIIVYCKMGVRSQNFAFILDSLGYKNVFDLGSIKDWPYELEK
ncbi:MAG: rhodanese-like domain-containing protein [Oscillospiraceae bacterium]